MGRKKVKSLLITGVTTSTTVGVQDPLVFLPGRAQQVRHFQQGHRKKKINTYARVGLPTNESMVRSAFESPRDVAQKVQR